ncbi:MAG TPA: hypothetical protein VJG49_01430 [Candidatus Nanoarchaeia archaeon]|nr:hypothetical protein [Candidatus Woesearchaeota archaeon]HIG93293.1 hypothetical protein [Candidatus Woesearchaeota archaeon]HIH13086.1 hypothetical protein [Candidatus Woesearchaeota archaeon]HLC88674.1 hypothetical protein [Candidatus Nanoarchaeia archaeon]
METFYVLKTESGSFYEVEEKKRAFGRPRWWIFFKRERVEVANVKTDDGLKPVTKIYDFLDHQPAFRGTEGMAWTSTIKAIYVLKKIVN